MEGDSVSDIEKEAQTVPPVKYEYLDHTADVQRHRQHELVSPSTCRCTCCWLLSLRSQKGGDSLTEAFEQAAVAMFGYMTELDTVDITAVEEVCVESDDLLSLFYKFLDEFLFLFCAEPFFIARKVKIEEFDKENFRIKAKGFGETFDLDKHPQGTEVKAVTYSNMQIHDTEDRHEVFVIIDI